MFIQYKLHNQIFYKSSTTMNELQDCSVDLIITSPPYFNIKDYSKNGYQKHNIQNLKKRIWAQLMITKIILRAYWKFGGNVIEY